MKVVAVDPGMSGAAAGAFITLEIARRLSRRFLGCDLAWHPADDGELQQHAMIHDQHVGHAPSPLIPITAERAS
jgi:hypothetical protein